LKEEENKGNQKKDSPRVNGNDSNDKSNSINTPDNTRLYNDSPNPFTTYLTRKSTTILPPHRVSQVRPLVPIHVDQAQPLDHSSLENTHTDLTMNSESLDSNMYDLPDGDDFNNAENPGFRSQSTSTSNADVYRNRSSEDADLELPDTDNLHGRRSYPVIFSNHSHMRSGHDYDLENRPHLRGINHHTASDVDHLEGWNSLPEDPKAPKADSGESLSDMGNRSMVDKTTISSKFTFKSKKESITSREGNELNAVTAKNNSESNHSPDIADVDIKRNKSFGPVKAKSYIPQSTKVSHIEEGKLIKNRKIGRANHYDIHANQRTEVTINIGRIVIRTNPKISSSNRSAGQPQINLNADGSRNYAPQNSPPRSSFILPKVSISDYRRMRAAGML